MQNTLRLPLTECCAPFLVKEAQLVWLFCVYLVFFVGAAWAVL